MSNDLLTSPYLASRDGKASGTADALSISEEDETSEKWEQKIGNLPVDAVFTYWGLACSLCNREVFLPEGGTFKLKLIMILGNIHCPTILAFVAPSSHLNLNSICLKFKYILCFICTNTPSVVVRCSRKEVDWNVIYIEYICLFEKTDERVDLNFIWKCINVFVSKQWEIVKGHQSQLTQNSQPRRQKQSTHAKRAGTMHNSFNWNWN